MSFLTSSMKPGRLFPTSVRFFLNLSKMDKSLLPCGVLAFAVGSLLSRMDSYVLLY